MSDYAALRLLVTAPPYDKMDDRQAADALKTAVLTRMRPIPAREIKKLWGRWGVLGMVWVKAENTALPDEIRALCRSTYDNLMSDLFADMDPADETALPDILRYLNGLEAASVLTTEQREATLALATETVSLLDSVGWASLREMDERSAALTIAAARKS